MSLTKIGVALLATATIGMAQTAEAGTTEQVDVITAAQPCDNKKTIVTVAETQEQQPTQEEILQQEQEAREAQAMQDAQAIAEKAQEATLQAQQQAEEARKQAEQAQQQVQQQAEQAQQQAQQEQQANTWTCDKCGQQIQNNIPKEVHDKAMHAEQQAEPQEETETQYDGICEKCGSTFVGPYNEHVCQK